jgi:ubiquinone/menaquinone biosynthesis C-methylase UbiE
MEANEQARDRSGAGNKPGLSVPYFESRYDPGRGDYLRINQVAAYRLHHQAALSLLRTATRDSGRPLTIVDAGCACGDFSALVDAALPGWRVVGLDFVWQGLVEGHARYPNLRLVQGRLPDLPFGTGGVDVVVCMEVLYYLERDALARAIREVARVLAPGGYLLVGTTLGDPARYFTEQTLINALAPSFVLEGSNYEHGRPYTALMRALRRVEVRLPQGNMLRRLLLRVRCSTGLARGARAVGGLLGRRAVSNGTFLFRSRQEREHPAAELAARAITDQEP